MFGRSTSQFDRLLEKATSQLLLEPDWGSIMQICDSIRQGDTNPKYAVTATKKKFYHTNPHVALYALQVMESCVKNCGVLVHEEVATKQFMEELRDLVKQATDENIKTKVLELLQTWGMAFRNSPKYRIVTDTLNLMKAEGWKFPPVREAEAMFEADTAPEWADGDVCNRCRVQFSTFTRQHHCRACGQVFCSKCSAKSCVLPKFGIEREVRVCDTCYDQFGPTEAETTPQGTGEQQEAEKSSDLPAEYLASPLSKQPQEPQAPKAGTKSETELKEEEELQLVLALSKSEADEKEQVKKKTTSTLMAEYSNGNATHNVGKNMNQESDPELEKYLNREYWEAQQKMGGMEPGVVVAKGNMMPLEVEQQALQGTNQWDKNKADEEELDEFTASLRTQLEIFVNRMKSNSSRGRPIANDSSVQTLFMNVMTMHGKLVQFIQEQEDSRVQNEVLQDKLTQVKDARAALDALREEEAERKRRELEELERQRQVQLAAKLEVMRKKKAEYLEYQRQMALQRMADQEREAAKGLGGGYMPPQGMYNMYLPYGYQQPGGRPMGMGDQQAGMPPNPAMEQMPPGVPQQPNGAPPQPGFPQHYTMPHQPGMYQQPGVPQQQGMPPQTTDNSHHAIQQPGMMIQPGMAQQSGMLPQQMVMPHQQIGNGMQQPGMTQQSTIPPQQSIMSHQSVIPPQQPGAPSQIMSHPTNPGYPQDQTNSSFNMSTMASALPGNLDVVSQPDQPPQAPDQSLISFD